MGQTVMMQIRFSEDVLVKGMTLSYSDALYYTPEQYAAMKQSDIDAVKAERVANWKNIVENPAPVKEVTKEELIAQIAAMDEQKVSLEAQKAEIEAKIVAMDAVAEEPVEEPKEPVEEVKP
jgi:hypothetical protein